MFESMDRARKLLEKGKWEKAVQDLEVLAQKKGQTWSDRRESIHYLLDLGLFGYTQVESVREGGPVFRYEAPGYRSQAHARQAAQWLAEGFARNSPRHRHAARLVLALLTDDPAKRTALVRQSIVEDRCDMARWWALRNGQLEAVLPDEAERCHHLMELSLARADNLWWENANNGNLDQWLFRACTAGEKPPQLAKFGAVQLTSGERVPLNEYRPEAGERTRIDRLPLKSATAARMRAEALGMLMLMARQGSQAAKEQVAFLKEKEAQDAASLEQYRKEFLETYLYRQNELGVQLVNEKGERVRLHADGSVTPM